MRLSETIPAWVQSIPGSVGDAQRKMAIDGLPAGGRVAVAVVVQLDPVALVVDGPAGRAGEHPVLGGDGRRAAFGARQRSSLRGYCQ